MAAEELYRAADPLAKLSTSDVDPLITLLGVPFDATSTYRTGSRFGPNAIREAFMNIEIYSKRLDIDLETRSLDDIGNLTRIGSVSKMSHMVEEVTRSLSARGQVPAVLGGEHSITNGAIRGIRDKCALIVFDAHFDLRTEFEGLQLSHATFLRRLVDDDVPSKVIHIGARAATKSEWDFVSERGIDAIYSDDLGDIHDAVNRFKSILSDVTKVYVSIDLDVIDPGFAPGVANPEANGISPHDLLEFLFALQNKSIAGFDIVELCPQYDNGSTTSLAAKLLLELSCLVESKHLS
jgi:agmatinase